MTSYTMYTVVFYHLLFNCDCRSLNSTGVLLQMEIYTMGPRLSKCCRISCKDHLYARVHVQSRNFSELETDIKQKLFNKNQIVAVWKLEKWD